MENKKYVEKAREIPVYCETDVLVVGGGPAGMAAAVAAKRAGADTMLVERYGCFGGTITQVGMGGIAWYRYPKTIEAGGLSREFEDRANAWQGKKKVVGFAESQLDTEPFKYVADQILVDAGVRTLLHCAVVDVIVEDGCIKGVITESKSGRMAIMAKRVVDCSGDADVAYRAGAPCNKREKSKMLGCTPMFSCTGVDTKKLDNYLKNELKPTFRHWGGYWSIDAPEEDLDLPNPHYMGIPMAEVQKKGVIEQRENVSIGGSFNRMDDNGQTHNMNCVFISNFDGTDVEDLTKAEIVGRQGVYDTLTCLREGIPGFENAKLRNFGMTIGVRETRRIEGQYTLTGEDVISEARFDDTIAVIPEFLDGENFLRMPQTGRYYQMPYRMLVPQKIDNLLVAGRCISSEPIAVASTRNMVCCFASGQAAGVAAAVSVSTGTGTAAVDIKQVQEELKRQDVRID